MTKVDKVRACLDRGMTDNEICKELGMCRRSLTSILGYMKRRDDLREIRKRCQGFDTFDKWQRTA